MVFLLVVISRCLRFCYSGTGVFTIFLFILYINKMRLKCEILPFFYFKKTVPISPREADILELKVQVWDDRDRKISLGGLE